MALQCVFYRMLTLIPNSRKNYSGEMSGIDNCGNGSAERLDYLFAEFFYFLPDLTFNGVSLLLFSVE